MLRVLLLLLRRIRRHSGRVVISIIIGSHRRVRSAIVDAMAVIMIITEGLQLRSIVLRHRAAIRSITLVWFLSVDEIGRGCIPRSVIIYR